MNLFWALEWMRALWKGTAGRTSGEVADASTVRSASDVI